MNHLSPEQLTDAYYGEGDSVTREHLRQCDQCAGEYRLLAELLGTIRSLPVPEPQADYEKEVWTRLLPRLSQRKPWLSLLWRFPVLVPAFGITLAVVFVAGMLTQAYRQPRTVSEQESKRLLLISLSDHLERSQVLLTELLNAPPETLDIEQERSRARDLLAENRLLRKGSAGAGATARSATLDDLERVLLELANSPPDLSAESLQALRSRIQNDGLLFKVRVTGAGVRHEGKKL